MLFLFQLQFSAASFGWLLFSLLLGLAYAFLLYSRKSELTPVARRWLFAARTVLVALITFLLFAPLVRSVDRTLEKPLIIIAQDNSASIALNQPKSYNLQEYSRQLNSLPGRLSGDYEVRTLSFGGSVQNGLKKSYSDKATDISAVFKSISSRFANRNIGAIVLASDGIYTNGGNPAYEAESIAAPVYTIAMGDTVPKKDLLIAGVSYNNIAYLGNDFQVEVAVEASLCKGSGSLLTVKDSRGTAFSKPVSVNSNDFRQVIPVTLPARQKGLQRFTVSISPLSGELTTSNNTFTFFTEVIDGKQKILIVALSAHPDLSAIKQSIENNRNYEVKSVLQDDASAADVSKADLVIFHQLPGPGSNAALLRAAEQKPALYISGSQTQFSAFAAAQPVVALTASGQSQEVTAEVNADFYGFTLSETTRSRLPGFAPLVAPFGNYGLKGTGTVLLTQRIGRVGTDRPLLAFGGSGAARKGVLTGEGIWRWRLEEFMEHGDHQAVDELLGKTVQYLSSRDDKRKFRAYTARNTFDENEVIHFDAELYNDAYELINQPDVQLVVRNRRKQNFSFLFSRSANAYTLDAGSLPAGEYSFEARTRFAGKDHRASGNFIVTQQQAEFRQVVANHPMLYSLARNSGGQFLYPQDLSSLPERLKKDERVKTVSYEDVQFRELVNEKWLFFLIVALLGAEWFARKRAGEEG
jgi:hypothetical protein